MYGLPRETSPIDIKAEAKQNLVINTIWDIFGFNQTRIWRSSIFSYWHYLVHVYLSAVDVHQLWSPRTINNQIHFVVCEGPASHGVSVTWIACWLVWKWETREEGIAGVQSVFVIRVFNIWCLFVYKMRWFFVAVILLSFS